MSATQAEAKDSAASVSDGKAEKQKNLPDEKQDKEQSDEKEKKKEDPVTVASVAKWKDIADDKSNVPTVTLQGHDCTVRVTLPALKACRLITNAMKGRPGKKLVAVRMPGAEALELGWLKEYLEHYDGVEPAIALEPLPLTRTFEQHCPDSWLQEFVGHVWAAGPEHLFRLHELAGGWSVDGLHAICACKLACELRERREPGRAALLLQLCKKPGAAQQAEGGAGGRAQRLPMTLVNQSGGEFPLSADELTISQTLTRTRQLCPEMVRYPLPHADNKTCSLFQQYCCARQGRSPPPVSAKPVRQLSHVNELAVDAEDRHLLAILQREPNKTLAKLCALAQVMQEPGLMALCIGCLAFRLTRVGPSVESVDKCTRLFLTRWSTDPAEP